MATKQHLLDAELLAQASRYNLTDWSPEERQAFDRWMFQDGQWNYFRDTWVDYSRMTQENKRMAFAAQLASALAKENNKP